MRYSLIIEHYSGKVVSSEGFDSGRCDSPSEEDEPTAQECNLIADELQEVAESFRCKAQELS